MTWILRFPLESWGNWGSEVQWLALVGPTVSLWWISQVQGENRDWITYRGPRHLLWEQSWAPGFHRISQVVLSTPLTLVATHQGWVATNLFPSSFCWVVATVAPCLHSYAEEVATIIQSLWPVRMTFVCKWYFIPIKDMTYFLKMLSGVS